MFRTYLWDAHLGTLFNINQLLQSLLGNNMFKVHCIFVVSNHKFWYKWVTTGTVFILLAVRMSCALRSDGQLKDGYDDPDDDTPMPAPPPLPASNGTLTALVSCRSGLALKPTEKIREATNAALTERSAPVPPQSQPVPKHSHLVCYHNDNDNDDPPVLENFSDDKEEEEDKDKDNKDLEEAYQRTKAFGDEDCEDRKQTKKDECSADLKGIFTQEKGCINPHTQECEDGWWCEIQ
jgi:hypothetical protein